VTVVTVEGENQEWWRLPLPRSGGQLELDRRTGLLAGLSWPGTAGPRALPVTASIELLVGGSEARPVTGGLEYPGATWLRGSELTEDDVATTAGARRVPTSVAGWPVTWNYELRAESPRLRTRLTIMRPRTDPRPLRNVALEFFLGIDDPAQWALHVPGNRLRPGAPLSDLRRPIAVSPAAGSLGSPGLIVLSHRRDPACLVVWPLCRTEIGQILLQPSEQGLGIRITTDLAGDPPFGTELEYAGVNFDVLGQPWSQVRAEVPAWIESVGIRSAGAKPGWTRSAGLYEVQVGRSVFAGGYGYEPYPQLRDVVADLPRIADLGFDTIQLMPRQPYPSYNVHDYADVDTTYGGVAELHELVERSHALGLRVILDVLLHGVIDRRSVRAALTQVEDSGLLAGPAPVTGDVFADTPASWPALQRAWGQHIVDFAPYWIAGSPEVHRLTQEQPGWFCRDSAGHLTGIYTEAFDLANADWQRYFCVAMLDLVDRFQVDGFRFDAPTYNNFASWAPERRIRASAATLGCLTLFERLRPLLKGKNPDLMMFTEPSGLLLREFMDVNYNYDELWLLPAVLEPGVAGPGSVATGSDVAAWMDERQATLPADALTAHHIDSHDTFWWPPPGRKWRREQYGIPATRAWMWILALSGGPYMTFVGGEAGIEDDLRRTLRLRQARSELRVGAARFAAVSVDRPEVFAVVRECGPDATLVLVNLSAEPLTVRATMTDGLAPGRYEDYYTPTRPMRAAGDSSLAVEFGSFELALIELTRTAPPPR
jgi:glycosidase